MKARHPHFRTEEKQVEPRYSAAETIFMIGAQVLTIALIVTMAAKVILFIAS